MIDTYHPDGGGSCDTFLTIFDVSGDPDADDPFSYLDAPTDSLAESDSSPDGAQQFFARVDYQPGTALDSGDILYIRVMKGPTANTLANGDYAIRVLA